jgi:hypothetical protein
MVDDLKDVLESTLDAGKTVARDLLLDRPNAAHAMGVPGAILRLARFLQLGDTMLRQLLKAKPELGFLGKLRNDLQEELVLATGSACATAPGVCE